MNEREQDWNTVEANAKLVEKWAVTQPKEIQIAIQRLISAAYSEQAIEEVERMQNE